MPRTKRPTRDRILDAANRLFYAEGIRAVSLDAIAAKAGVTKRTLYYHFVSKDDLVACYLESRDQPNLQVFARWFDEAEGTVSDKVAAIFQQLAKSSTHPKWKGCGFLRTIAELASMPGHPAVKIGAAHKKKFEAWLAQELKKGRIDDPARTARQIALLMEGTFATLLMHRDPAYAHAAATAAGKIVQAKHARAKPDR